MKTKTVSILLMAAMALSLAACGFSNSTDSSSKSSSKAESTSASSASSEAESASSAKSTADGEVFDDTTVTVFAAKSLNSVMETLISEYNKTQPNVKLVGSYDSSGTLIYNPHSSLSTISTTHSILPPSFPHNLPISTTVIFPLPHTTPPPYIYTPHYPPPSQPFHACHSPLCHPPRPRQPDPEPLWCPTTLASHYPSLRNMRPPSD